MDETAMFLAGGEWRTSSEVKEVRFPYTGDIVGRVCLAQERDLEDAVESAGSGAARLASMAAHERSAILSRLAELVEERREQFVGTLVMEGGKTRTFASGEVSRAVQTLKVSAGEAVRLCGQLIPLDGWAGGEGHTAIIRRFPVGTVLGITPFNFPLNLACHKLGPAIAAGNAFILKPSSATPLSALLLGELALEAGMPPAALSVVPCAPALAEKMAAGPGVDLVSFTGSPDVGWHLAAVAARKKVCLELGGNAACIVHDDADLAYAASRIVQGAFVNAGQVCISVQRVFVQDDVCEEFTDLLLAGIRDLRTGDPRDEATDVGPMISETAAAAAYEKVTEAVSAGAEVLIGGLCDGTLFVPTVLARTTPSMRVNREEIFAPVVTVTPYRRLGDAVAMADDTIYGLQAGIFTDSLSGALQAFEGIRVGGLQVNDIPTFRVDAMPYGGLKASGAGKEGPARAILEMTEERMMVVNRR
jgi:acyl-CoA reductase-like NAD-dependent aldehyde dehydrogenase